MCPATSQQDELSSFADTKNALPVLCSRQAKSRGERQDSPESTIPAQIHCD
jgi:hypothetical protein